MITNEYVRIRAGMLHSNGAKIVGAIGLGPDQRLGGQVALRLRRSAAGMRHPSYFAP